MLDSIYHCKVLPLERIPLTEYVGPASSDRKRPASMFEELDFKLDPVSIQPKLYLVNWFRARRVDCRLSDPRPTIEEIVVRCR